MSVEPQIQYARTSDGVSIAYTNRGDGPPLLYCPDHTIALQHHWEDSSTYTIRMLSARTSVTIFDAPGIGASQRDVSDFSLEAQVRAIEAVATHLAASKFTLVGSGSSTACAALYSTRHPDSVRDLVCLYPAFTIVRRTGAAIRDNWSLDRRRAAGKAFPDGPVSGQRWFSHAMRESMTAEVYAAYRVEFADADLRAIYQRIPVPTLLCIAKEGPSREASLALASVVPNCRVTTIRGAVGDAVPAILEFMGVETGQGSSTPAASVDARGTAVILFTDIVDSTALTERLGDTAFRDKARDLDASLRTIIREHSGTCIDAKTLGDGVLATFTSAAQAIEAALTCGKAGEDAGLPLHLGLHAGDVIREDNNVYGGAVNIASRISGLSAPGEVLVSDTVRSLARTSAGASFDDRGEHTLKGVAEPHRLFAVREIGD